jgi:hypothetical protein
MPHCGVPVSETGEAENIVRFRTFEPWLGGDRQKEKHVAKARYRCKQRPLKSVCRELPRVALAACSGDMYRLRMNRAVQA